jgi:flavin reductase
MNRTAKLNPTFHATRILCVNVLAPEHEELSPVFASIGEIPMAERFALARWIRLTTGAPALESAAASFDCTIDQITEVGTHSVFFCGVKAIRLGPPAALIYHNRAYHRIHPQAA